MQLSYARSAADIIGGVLSAGFEIKARESYPSPFPTIKELLIFGSVARGSKLVRDLDLMLILSHDMPLQQARACCTSADDHRSYSQHYSKLRVVLPWMLAELEMFPWIDARVEVALKTQVDLLVFPLEFLISPAARAGYQQLQRDPKFFRNAFQDILVLEQNSKFSDRLPDPIGYFERKYQCNLSDIR